MKAPRALFLLCACSIGPVHLAVPAPAWAPVAISRPMTRAYRLTTGSGTIDAKIVVLAAGAGATPVILQRSEAELGVMPDAVGRYFSGNGERLNTAIMNEDAISRVLGLSREDGAGLG